MRKCCFLILVALAAVAIGCKSGGGGGGEDTGTGQARPDTGTGEAPEDTGTGEAPADTGTGTGEAPEDTGTGEVAPCAGVMCNAPPENSCDGSFGIEVSNSVGWCDRGECYYGARAEVCVGTCEEGVCTGAPCQGVTCNQPPDPECEDADTLRVFNSVGYCTATGGVPECRYSSREEACEGGCEDGKCVDDPCANVICDDPPARYCDGDNLVVWDTIPRCEDGECLYGMQTVACATGCENGGCVDDNPCANVICKSPPASHCADDGTLRAFSRQGSCHEGACIYLHEDLPCEGGCEDGQCTGDPCTGVDCGEVPALYCIDDTSLALWDGHDGTCVEGVCAYGAETVTCDGGCEDGACQGDACLGVTCAMAPADFCQDDETVADFITPGTCEDGACSYGMDDVPCESGCEDGVCVEEGDTEVDTETNTGTGEERDTETETGTGVEMDTETETGTGVTEDTDTGTEEEASSDSSDPTDSSDTGTDTNTETVTPSDTDSYTLEDGLIAYYPFNGNADDESGNGHDGSLIGSPVAVSDRFGNAESTFEFNGETDYIDLGEPIIPTDGTVWSVALWIRTDASELPEREDYFLSQYRYPETGPEEGRMYMFIRDRLLFIGLDCTIVDDVSQCRPIGNEIVSPGNWTFLTVVYNEQDIRLYRNAMPPTIDDGPLRFSVIDENTHIGHAEMRDTITPRFFRGLIDDVRFYNRALSSEEVLSLYHEGGWQSECAGQPDFTPCTVVTEPDRDYDICVNEVCVSPGCEDSSCNVPGPHFPLPDTSQTVCYDNSGVITCPNEGEDFYGQDAQYGRDFEQPGTLRYDRTEPVLDEPVVGDNVTGLMWQGCAAGRSTMSCSEGTVATYDWYEALNYCNGLDWGGYDDWRMPDIYELQSMFHYGNSAPVIDTDAFPSTPISDYYWALSSSKQDSGLAWITFLNGNGSTSYTDKSFGQYVRCVRGVPSPRPSSFLSIDLSSSDEPSVQDLASGLTWQGCVAGLTGDTCGVGNVETYTWQEALSYCEGLTWAGRSDWRLPNIFELFTIIDTAKFDPAINDQVFPATPSENFWSSTTYAFGPSGARDINFLGGTTFYSGKNVSYNVRCVLSSD